MRMNRQPAPAICRNCEHHVRQFRADGQGSPAIVDACGHPRATDPVTGDVLPECWFVRLDPAACGRLGMLFKERRADALAEAFDDQAEHDEAEWRRALPIHRRLIDRVRRWFR